MLTIRFGFQLLISVLLLFNINLNAQDSFVASGGDIKSTKGSASYSVGQVFQNFTESTNGSIAEGVQQPYEISVISGIFKLPDYNLSVFPNPSTVFIILKIENVDIENMTYQLFDLQGKLIINSLIKEKETIIVTETLMPSNYILKVFEGRNEIKTFKILKH